MLYAMLFSLRETYSAFNVFGYITFRSALAALTALLLSLFLGPSFIRFLRRLSVGQTIREEGPKSHHSKAGTPTMGGLLIVFAIVVPTLLWADLKNRFVLIVLLSTLLFSAIGFWDDIRKVRRRHNLGLRVKSKLLAQFAVAFAMAWLLARFAGLNGELQFPFFKTLVLDLGWMYLPFVGFVIVGTSNTVNLTDGLDGLAIGAALIVAATYALFTYIAGNAIAARYLQVAGVPGAGEVAVFCSAMVGASIGFLWWNSHPAEVFMGDVGSLGIGGAIGTVAVVAKQELLLVIVGGLFVIEGLSVMLQVASFKLTGKRIFRMAPIHHHFEALGWPESKVIVRFWIVSIVFALLGLSTLKLR